MIHITKVVSRNFIMDFVSKFQNAIGLNLTSYEKMINEGMDQVQKEIKKRRLKLKWYRYEISQLTSGAMVIMLYGDEK